MAKLGEERTQQNSRRRRNYWKAQSQEGMVLPWSLPSTEVGRRRTENRTPLASRGPFRVSFHVAVAERCDQMPDCSGEMPDGSGEAGSRRVRLRGRALAGRFVKE